MPLAYYLGLCVLMGIVMAKSVREIRMQSHRPAKEDEPRGDEEEVQRHGAPEHANRAGTGSLCSHFDTIDLYVPPLTAELLNAAFKDTAWMPKTSARVTPINIAAHPAACTSSTRIAAAGDSVGVAPLIAPSVPPG